MADRDLKQELISLIVQYGIDEAEQRFLADLPALHPDVVRARRHVLSQLVQDDTGEWYFDE